MLDNAVCGCLKWQKQSGLLCDSTRAQFFIKSDRIHFSTQPSHSSITDTARGSSNSRVTNIGSEKHRRAGLDQIHGENECWWICFTGHVSRGQGVTHFQHMISHDAFGLYKDLVDHRVTMVTVHLMDSVLVKLGQRQQHLQGQSLCLLTVTQLHRLDAKSPRREMKGKKNETTKEPNMWTLTQ